MSGQPSSSGTGHSTFWRNKSTYVTVAAAGFAAYAAYRAYNASSTQSSFNKFRTTLSNYASALAAVSGSCSLIANDLQTFLTSDSAELPQSLRQLNKLLQSGEVQSLLQTSVATVARGVAEGASTSFASETTGPSALETVIEAVLSDRGHSLLGMAVGIASKNVTATLCEFVERMQASTQQGSQQASQFSLEKLMQLLASEEGDKILSLLVTKSIRTAVGTYCDATSGMNIYDDMVSSIVKVEHRDAVADIMTRTTAAFCKEIATAYRKATSGPANVRPLVQEVGTSSGQIEDMGRSSMDGSSSSFMLPAAESASYIPMRTSSQHASQAKTRGSSPCIISLKQNVPRPHPPAWLRQVVDLVREKDVRSLAVDVVGSATREATRGVVETLVTSYQVSSSRACVPSVVPVYALLTVAVTLMMYVMCPPVSV